MITIILQGDRPGESPSTFSKTVSIGLGNVEKAVKELTVMARLKGYKSIRRIK